MISAIEQGIITDSTKTRLQELEGKKKDIEIEIAKEQIAKPKYTREQYKKFFEKSKVADLTEHNQRKALINYFVNANVVAAGGGHRELGTAKSRFAKIL